MSSLYLRKLCAKFSWNMLNGSGENDFSKIDDVFFIFHTNCPFDEALAFHLTSMNLFSPNDVLLQICHNINLISKRLWNERGPYLMKGLVIITIVRSHRVGCTSNRDFRFFRSLKTIKSNIIKELYRIWVTYGPLKIKKIEV